GLTSVACVAARYLSTPFAKLGLSQRHSSAVIMPSRPNGVLNHGTPAYGYGPYGVWVTIMCTSDAARSAQSLNRSLDARNTQACSRESRKSPVAAARASA